MVNTYKEWFSVFETSLQAYRSFHPHASSVDPADIRKAALAAIEHRGTNDDKINAGILALNLNPPWPKEVIAGW